MSGNPFIKNVQFIKSATAPEHYPASSLPEVAIAGRSNVGKSSLINCFTNRKRLAKVSNTPGRTQLLNFFQINDAFMLCDLPGYGYAKVPYAMKANWETMIGRYLEVRSRLRVVLLLIDIRRDPEAFEQEIMQISLQNGHTVVPIATKADKLSSSNRAPAVQRIAQKLGISPKKVILWSSETGLGIEPLWKTLERLLGLKAPAAKEAPAAPKPEDPENAPAPESQEAPPPGDPPCP